MSAAETEARRNGHDHDGDEKWCEPACPMWFGLSDEEQAARTTARCEGLAPFCCGNPSCPAHGQPTDHAAAPTSERGA